MEGRVENLGVARECDPCHWVHKTKGGQPLSVAICSLCGNINWPLLKEDFEKAARAYARGRFEAVYGRHDYPDGSVGLCRRPVVNVNQQYDMFREQPRNDFADHGPFVEIADAMLVAQMEQTATDPSSRVRRGRPTRNDHDA